jgi:uncharacterized protein
MRVVADTNIYILALLFGGLPGAFLEYAFQRAFILVTSPALLDELDEKLRMKFEVVSEDADAIRIKLEKIAYLVRPDMMLDIVKDDPDDNRVLECAVTGKATHVVSGDRHLLKLISYETMPIMTVRQFLEVIGLGSDLKKERRT